ncbi:MAG TPA: DUF6328 family protein [Nocardioides sp.]|nr:DUF6328 family protein [Nocardioides sp.]
MSSAPDPDDPRVQDRNWNELLQELRVTQTGVQVLSAFLMTVPFSNRFGELDGTERTAYLLVFACSVVATALLVAPVAFHRVLFRQRRRRWLIEAANVCARAGLAALAATTSGIFFIVVDLVVSRAAGWAALAIAGAAFALLWLVVPWTADRADPESVVSADNAEGSDSSEEDAGVRR